jgi:hypothetical protein
VQNELYICTNAELVIDNCSCYSLYLVTYFLLLFYVYFSLSNYSVNKQDNLNSYHLKGVFKINVTVNKILQNERNKSKFLCTMNFVCQQSV